MTSLLVLLLAATGAAGAAPAAATAPEVGWVSALAGPSSDLTRDAGTRTVQLTLVTGDTVHVTTGADGRQAATVTPAPRPDGSSPGFWTHQLGEDLYVVPQDVAGLLPQRLDPALFNVSTLLEQSFGDAQNSSLPLIVTYRPHARLRAQSVPSSAEIRQWDSVHGLGLQVDKERDTAAIREALHQLAALPPARTLAAGPFAGIDKIWLDHPIEAALSDSTGQIGAPAAWQQGYDGTGITVAVLDTGIDDDHPDLAGKVVAAANFSTSETTDDRHGHGTHVASTVAGTGAASDGQYTGVAPGADLINAKVLNDFGSGNTSDLIDAMEWAAQQGADIVNLSLGVRGQYTDGTDPASLAINSLTEQYGTLFVVSAGNDGPRDSTVTTPGSAEQALTVGAVDSTDNIAAFSSRGPRAGDYALKPDITAPGVAIVAARADGTSMGEPVNDFYTAESGTSMAAPHVAGVAALVAGARPDLDAMQLKALLMGTASPNDGLDVFAQGAGRVEVGTALAGSVLADPPSVSFGDFSYPHDQRDPITQTVTYTNLNDEPQTLELAIDVANRDGEPAPEGSLALSSETVTLPAGGAATVTITLDTDFPGSGYYGGMIVAQTADGEIMRTPVGYHKEQAMYDLRVEGIARDGRDAQGRFRVVDVTDGSVAAFRSWGASGDDSCTTDSWGANNCVRVPPGSYSISGLVFTMPEWASSTQPPGQFDAYLNTTLVVEPEISIDGTTTLTLDARDAVEVQIDTPDHRTKRNAGAAQQINFYREPENGPAVTDGFLFSPRSQLEQRLFLQPTSEVTHGRLAAYTRWQLEAPAITLDVVGSGAVPLEPYYYDPSWFSDNSWQYPRLEGRHQLPVVDAGTATAAEIDGLDLAGALALIRRSDAISVGEQSNNAAGAGAAMVAVYHDVPGSNAAPGATGVRLQVPTVRLSHAEGTGVQQLLQQGPVTVAASGEPASPYRYNLTYVEDGRIRTDLRYVAATDRLAAVANSFHTPRAGELTLTESLFTWQPWESFAMSFPTPTLGGPRTRIDYYVPGVAEYDHRVSTPETRYNYLWPAPEQAQMHLQSQLRSFQAGEQVQQSWLKAPLRPGLWPDIPVRRTGDALTVQLAAFVDGGGNVAEGYTSWFDGGFATAFKMYADGELIVERDGANSFFMVPADSEDFRIEYNVDNASEWAEFSHQTRSVWTFSAPRPADGQTQVAPLLTVDYDIDVNLHNRMPLPAQRRGPHTIEFTVGHQVGAPPSPVRTASLEVSYDSGENWQQVGNLRRAGDGRFMGFMPAAAPPGSDGYVSLRVRAEDRAGNTVEQEIIRAYAFATR